MKFSYEALLSGNSIDVSDIGHLRPPKIKEIMPGGSITEWCYRLYISILSWDKKEFVNFLQVVTKRNLQKITDNEKLTTFDAATILDEGRELLQNAMAFFIEEDLQWNQSNRCFEVYVNIPGQSGEKVGEINQKNFEDVRDMMLQLNYIGVGKEAAPVQHSSEQARLLWERAQKYLKEQNNKTSDTKNYAFGNMISKLCAANIGYTLFNIYDLTVFQLYDQFFQYGYLRAMNLNEMAYSNHGGEKFDIQAWLKPIIKF